MNLTPIQAEDLSVNQPIPWDLFDQSQRLIQKRGYVVKSQVELDQLYASPLYRQQSMADEPSESDKTKANRLLFEQMQLKIGQKMQLTLVSQSVFSKEAGNKSFPAILIGYVHDLTFMVSIPLAGFKSEPFLEGDQVQIRLFNNQSAYSFTVFIDKIIRLPFKYLHLSFPQNISAQHIRKSRRIRCHYPGSIENKDIALIITDLSINGAGIEASIPIGSLGSEVVLRFSIDLFGEETPLAVRSIIRSAKQVNKNDKKVILTGIEFIDLEKKQMTTLHHFIYQVIVEQPDRVI